MRTDENLPNALISTNDEKEFAKNKWQNQKYVRQFLDYCEKELEIKNPKDWYQVSRAQVKNLGGIFCDIIITEKQFLTKNNEKIHLF